MHGACIHLCAEQLKKSQQVKESLFNRMYFPTWYLEAEMLWKGEGISGSGDNPGRRINEGTFHSTSQKKPSGKTVKFDLLFKPVSLLERCMLDLIGK